MQKLNEFLETNMFLLGRKTLSFLWSCFNLILIENTEEMLWNKVKYCLENNIDPLGRDYAKYEIVEVDDNYPKYIINNKEKFDYLIKK